MAMCEYNHNQSVIEAHQHPLLTGRPFAQTILCLGPLAIIPMPGEIFSGISLRLRQGSPFAYTLCCSVSNGSLGYVPTREARHRGGYECWVGKAVGPYLLADHIDDALVEQNLKVLRATKTLCSAACPGKLRNRNIAWHDCPLELTGLRSTIRFWLKPGQGWISG